MVIFMILQTVTNYGKVDGVLSPMGFALYKGIPYAAPPVGELRFHPPVKPVSWDGVRVCDHFGNACLQPTPHTPDTFYGKEFYASGDYPPSLAEDCLYLNVWTPAKYVNDKLPVMLWIHGGAYECGYGHEIEFDGDEYCKRGIILVTINYRLGVFGFFAHPELSKESNGSSGNYGLMDQIAALNWVKENIKAFGGNPDNITVCGQSAGSRSVNALACSPLTKGLFERAICQSGSGLTNPFSTASLKEMEQRGLDFVACTNAGSFEEFKKMSGLELLNHYTKDYKNNPRFEKTGFHICTDGYVLPSSVEDCILKGLTHDIDYMTGSNSDEFLGTKQLLDGNLNWADIHIAAKRKPFFHYYFAHKLPGDREGAFHSAELWYMFGTIKRCWRPMTEKDLTLSGIMLDYWSAFAKYGSPRAPFLKSWTPYSKEAPLSMCFYDDSYGMECLK
ncbi:carboxylesterase/lipase family protein [Anaerocolumna xylanovorans]|uniref:Carboxylic ester hydrolase n=1 Tax=Anaerocolumna xylanovorans DSM 12503 TaxID=1121345 RepID=A0A1M7Y5G7_9FIRM|nr:carboxylesterase family protein [Anaerocolumna xylanovorans]SHO47500.1 para-nitrobenzyl esterase [Anaerocolumna xylanovorans DSM 12503]